MSGISDKIADAILLGASMAFTIQFMVDREARLRAGRFALFALVNVAAYFALSFVPFRFAGIAAWVVLGTLFAFLFYCKTAQLNALYIFSFMILLALGQLILFFYGRRLGVDGHGSFAAHALGDGIVVALCALFLLMWNFFTRKSLKSRYWAVYARLESVSPSLVANIFIALMILLSALGLFWAYQGFTLASITRIRSSFILVLLILPVVNLLGYLLYKLAIRNKIKLDEQKKEYDRLLTYTGIIEKLTRDMRAFRHDFNNIMLTLRSFIEQKDMKGLADYYFREILKNQTVILNRDSVFLYIEYIRCIPLKGLLTTAFQRALVQGLNVSLFIDDYLDETGVAAIDLCRVMGIFLDNAIEAATESEEKVLSVSVLNTDASVSIVIANSFSVRPEMSRLFEEGYTTKGAGRGMGLSTLRAILDNYKHVTLSTVIEERFFIEEMNIEKSCRE